MKALSGLFVREAVNQPLGHYRNYCETWPPIERATMKILLAGDSTVANCPTEEFPMSGWGAHLAPHVHAWAAVHNFAKGGATTESFREEGLWQALLGTAEAGDMVLVQFGHNDQKQQHLAAGAGYSVNLHRMIREIRSLGASPILCTSVERRNFHKGVPVATLADYADAVGSVAEDMGVPVIDLHDWTSKLYAAAGEDGSAAYFTQFEPGTHAHWPEGIEDNTHFNQQGALLIAGFVAERVLELRDGVSEAK